VKSLNFRAIPERVWAVKRHTISEHDCASLDLSSFRDGVVGLEEQEQEEDAALMICMISIYNHE